VQCEFAFAFLVRLAKDFGPAGALGVAVGERARGVEPPNASEPEGIYIPHPQ